MGTGYLIAGALMLLGIVYSLVSMVSAAAPGIQVINLAAGLSMALFLCGIRRPLGMTQVTQETTTG